jgi:thiamine biosynthesis lipoprotein
MPRVIEHRFLAMGTEVSVKLMCPRRSQRPDALRAIRAATDLMHQFGRDAWAWGDGALSEFNKSLVAGAETIIPAHLRDLFARAWQIRRQSHGLFEPRLAQLVRLWGFDDVARLRDIPPTQHEIDTLLSALRTAPDYQNAGCYGPAPGVAWDFGGIGKGYIVDQALALLREHGFAHAIVDAGGNLAVRGTHHARPWRVAVRDPRSSMEPRRLLAALDAEDEAVITHGDDQRYFEHDGRRYAHILNPLTGAPVQGLRSLTVVHADATLADAGGAALFVAGPDGWQALARALDIDQVLAVREDGRIQATAALAVRLSTGTDVAIETFA